MVKPKRKKEANRIKLKLIFVNLPKSRITPMSPQRVRQTALIQPNGKEVLPLHAQLIRFFK
jgi:hypothetical protein